jgi:hypothetical protein
VYGLEKTVERLTEFFRDEGPFDGVIAFSQGGIAYRHFHRITQEIDPQTVQLPHFLITVASPVFPMAFQYKEEQYAQRFTPQFSFPSIHLYGTKDEYGIKNQRIQELFTAESSPKLLMYEDGHRWPRAIGDAEYATLSEFVR